MTTTTNNPTKTDNDPTIAAAEGLIAAEQKPTRTIARQMAKYAPGYEPGINARGQKTLTTGDDLAHALLALTPEQTMRLAERLIGLEDGELAERYDRLNPGQKRMNSGNQIRSRVKKGTLTIDEVKAAIRKLNQ